MLFGTENTIRSVAPFYKIDALCRIYNTDLYDNRDIMCCNLLRALDRLTVFCERNLPEWPYIEGIQRKSLRDTIFREVCLNLLIHSEYGSRHSSTFTIWNDRVEVVNWNIPYINEFYFSGLYGVRKCSSNKELISLAPHCFSAQNLSIDS